MVYTSRQNFNVQLRVANITISKLRIDLLIIFLNMYLLAGKKHLYNLKKYSKEKYPLRIREKRQLINDIRDRQNDRLDLEPQNPNLFEQNKINTNSTNHFKILLQKNGKRSPNNLIDNMDKDESDKDI